MCGSIRIGRIVCTTIGELASLVSLDDILIGPSYNHIDTFDYRSCLCPIDLKETSYRLNAIGLKSKVMEDV